jgi:tRNA A-37 threonylcarbamoyl transferase component Bud32/predicted esterase
MERRSLSHYEITGELGRGGMGVVYKATDTRLGRAVAIKLLHPDALGDADRRARFVREARAASALSHSGIITIYEIDQADGQDFIVFEYVEGESLQQVLARGAPPLPRALRWAVQIAEALAAAHRAGIVHRDLKPGNIMITGSDQAKLLDFGLAKQLSRTASEPDAATRTAQMETAAGSVLGTAAYMSPEQAEGRRVDTRSDVFSFGVVMYEMLAGRRAFAGETYSATLAAVLRDTPPAPAAPEKLRAILYRCLEKDREKRYPDACPLEVELRALERQLTSAGAIAWLRRPRNALAAALVVLLPLAAAAWSWARASRVQRLRNEVLPRVSALFDRGDYYPAFRLLEQARSVLPDDPEVKRLMSFTGRLTVETTPAGAEVFLGDCTRPDAGWDRLGSAPITDVPVAFGNVRFRITKAGFEPAEGTVFPAMEPRLTRTLAAAGDAPRGMVKVPQGTVRVGDADVTVPEFWLDRYEVSNGEFKEFVDAGGYEEPRYWKHPFVKDGRVLSSDEAMALLRDATGRPGPATWRLGNHADGQTDHPVSGVSWYEAAAFAEFKGKALPTIHHWRRAAGYGFFSEIVTLSNFGRGGPAPRGRFRGLGPFGTYDMAGNVKEWCWNASGAARYVLGGSWGEPSYIFGNAEVFDPLDRSPNHGFRCAKYLSPPPDVLAVEARHIGRNFDKERPASDEVFESFRSLYTYDRVDLRAKLESVVEDTRHWRQELVSFRAAYGDERVLARLFLPKNAAPPYQTVVYFPSGDAQVLPSSESIMGWWLDFIPLGGRALLHPIYKGTYERPAKVAGRSGLRDLGIAWAKDLSRSLDYLESRSDIDRERLAYYGISLGAEWAPVFLALEPRLKAAVLHWGGFARRRRPDAVEPVNFAPRVRMPVLMLNGRQDFIFPLDGSQRPLFRALGTPEADKKHVLYDSGHIPPKIDDAIRETLEWLDRYLGTVQTRSS